MIASTTKRAPITFNRQDPATTPDLLDRECNRGPCATFGVLLYKYEEAPMIELVSAEWRPSEKHTEGRGYRKTGKYDVLKTRT